MAETQQGMSDFMTADFAPLLEGDMLFRIVLQLGLFVLSAFFSGSETALFSLSRMELRKLRRQRSRYAEALHALLDQPRRLIIAILCGNMFVNVAATANLTGILIAVYGTERAAWISTFVMVPLLLLFGEATPKTVAVSDPVRISTSIVARPMSAWVAVVEPITSAIRSVSDRITSSIVGENRDPQHILAVDEFRTLVEEGVVRGELSAVERALIYNILQAGSAEIVEIMTPRPQAAFIDGDRQLTDIVNQFVGYRRSRVPVYRDTRDNVIGFLHEEEILRLVLDESNLSDVALADIMHPPVMVPSTKKIDEMFDYFQTHDAQAACILNEFGGIDGFITMNDVLAYVFGRPAAELPGLGVTHDVDSGIYEIPGDMKLIEFNKLTNFAITDSRMTTVGGVVLRQLDRLPKTGDTVAIENVSLVVTEMDGSRIARIRAGRVVPPLEDVSHKPGGGDDDAKSTDDPI